MPPTVDQLTGLDDELDFADPALPQFDILLAPLTPHFTLNALLHIPQRVDHPEVDITAIDERAQRRQQFIARGNIPGHWTRLDQRITFPFAPVLLVVTLQRCKAAHQRATIAERPQAHINAEHLPILGHGIQRTDQCLP